MTMAMEEDTSAPNDDSLIIPVTSGTNDSLFVEIFPEELKETSVSTLLKVLQNERPGLDTWADAALLYMKEKNTKECLAILKAACEEDDKNVRVLASTGIAYLSKSAGNHSEDQTQADQCFTQAASKDTFFPMTWMGRGMLNLNKNSLEQARFFFQTTLKECGPVLPALLGMAAVYYRESNYKEAQNQYAQAIRRYPDQSGAAARVGFGFCCYKLGQIDRSKAAFARALAMDPENVNAMVGAAILDMAAGGGTEQAIKKMSIANLLDHSNPMVQNHLANHYFWKWTAVTGTVSATHNSDIVVAQSPMSLESSDPIRIGTHFEATILEVVEEDTGATRFKLSKLWKSETESGLKVWKKDYERVYALAKGAYTASTVPEIKAESAFFLGRYYHVREENDNAKKLYQRACKDAPALAPARLGWAQTLIVAGEFGEAAKQLSQLLSLSSNATDAFALLGLLKVRDNKFEEGLAHLRKAMELEPANPDLVLLEALALQQRKSHYGKSLERYKKAVELLKRKDRLVPADLYINAGVLCQETKQFDEAKVMFQHALAAINEGGQAHLADLSNLGVDGVRIVHPENSMFFDHVECGLQASISSTTTLKLLESSTDIASLPFAKGDYIGIGDSFTSEVSNIEVQDGSVVVTLKEAYDPMIENEADGQSPATISIKVSRENKLLDIDQVLTVAFNIARLHEASGKTLAAIELHKAIVKRNPRYVNSYLRLACIAVDCGSLKECAQWLKIAAAAAPRNSEVLTLIGNLHLSLCDWRPAQKVFEGLLNNSNKEAVKKIEAYAKLSMGNIYFANLHVSGERYGKHLKYAADFYKSILKKDPLNAFAANGIGTVLAEKGEVFKAKEVFNRVREVSGDSLGDALLNLGHIFLSQKKHPEALQLYKSYLKRVEDITTPVTSKSRTDDVVDVLLYIAFAFFDWARHTELSNDQNAAPADGRYKQAIEHLELAIGKHSKKDVVLHYNLCMTKLAAANCVLQKMTRNIPRTVEEVEEALTGLEESLVVVQGILKSKEEGDKKISIKTSTLEEFIRHCEGNIKAAKNHLEDERARAKDEQEKQEIRKMAAEAARKEAELKEAIRKQEEAKKQEEMDEKAQARMRKVEELRTGWQQEDEAAQTSKASKGKNAAAPPPPDLEEDDAGQTAHGLFDDDSSVEEGGLEPEPPATTTAFDAAKKPSPSKNDLFGDSDGDSDDEEAAAASKPAAKSKKTVTNDALFGDSDDESDEELGGEAKASGGPAALVDSDDEPPKEEAADGKPKAATGTNQELFGETDEESDEELVPTGAKRGAEDDAELSNKKQKVDE